MNVERLLHTAFTESELAYLTTQAPFQNAVSNLHSPDDVEKLCQLAESLLWHQQSQPFTSGSPRPEKIYSGS